MHAYLALVFALAGPACSLPRPRDRIGFDREIDTNDYNQVPRLLGFVLSDDHIANQKNRGKLITKPILDEGIIEDNVILESNVVKIVPSTKSRLDKGELVRQRRGYNLQHVMVPARYPYLAVPRYDRFRRWSY